MLEGVLCTYDDGSKLEDVMRQVILTNPPDTPFTSGMKKSRATGTTHEWLEDAMATPTYNPMVEGCAITYETVIAPQRVTNYTQIFARNARFPARSSGFRTRASRTWCSIRR